MAGIHQDPSKLGPNLNILFNNILDFLESRSERRMDVLGLFEGCRDTGMPVGRGYREGKTSNRSALLNELLQ